ncbi:hypothetical protein [Pelagicoccus sp. SDUM812003]|uniref:hypothetical protein n=1 Tax=Pelagicoccus sp. SDUM812003 TaxID=3041267 RepID=UPI00280D25E8|nr:hypothetical protein [Pelagicoccus sp. SDUM812003]MDQ8203023.1 hypothetical protein [Pelagicoccus sp. SDUM812003]
MKTIFKTAFAVLATTVFASLLHAGGAVVVNASNNDSLDQEKIASVLVGKRQHWENGQQVKIAVLKGSETADALLESYARMNQSRFKSHWQRLAFSGRGTMPEQLESGAEVVAFVQSNPGAIGICDDSADLASVKKVN